MIKRRICAHFRCSRGEAAFVLGKSVGVERVLAWQVLHMNESLGAGDLCLKLSRRFPGFTIAIIGMARRGEISLRQLGSLGPFASRNARAQADAVAPRRRAEYSRQTRALEIGERNVLRALFTRGDGANAW